MLGRVWVCLIASFPLLTSVNIPKQHNFITYTATASSFTTAYPLHIPQLFNFNHYYINNYLNSNNQPTTATLQFFPCPSVIKQTTCSKSLCIKLLLLQATSTQFNHTNFEQPTNTSPLPFTPDHLPLHHHVIYYLRTYSTHITKTFTNIQTFPYKKPTLHIQ